MIALLALPAVGTETGEVKFAEGLSEVFFAAARAEGAETFFVVRAWGEFGAWIYVKVETFVAVGAVQGARVVRAFVHESPV